jgi:hypothetical protein
LDASGLNVWHGTVMSSSARWLTIGVVLDVVAILLLVRAGLLLRLGWRIQRTANEVPTVLRLLLPGTQGPTGRHGQG